MNKKKLLLLTESQKNIWLTQNIYHDCPMFNIGGLVRINGPIDIEKLKSSIFFFVQNHDSFNIRLVENNGIKQYFSELKYEYMEIKDFSTYEHPEEELKKWANLEFSEVFDMIDKPLYKFAIFKLSEFKYGYMVKCHHIIADGWSMQLLTNEICNLYNTLKDATENNYNPEFSYEQYLCQQYHSNNSINKEKKFWEECILNFDFSETERKIDTEGRRKTFFISEELSMSLKKFCKKNGITLNTYFIMIILLYMYKNTGKNDLCVGIPLMGRTNRREIKTFGMFVNVIPFIYHIDNNTIANEMFKNAAKELKSYYKNQWYPYREILREKGYNQHSFYSTCINYYGTQMGSKIGGFHTQNEELYNGHQEYDLQYIIREWQENESIQIDIDYKISQYSEENIDLMFECIISLTDEILFNANRKISSLGMVKSEEYQKTVVKYNDTYGLKEKKTVVDLFRQKVIQMPSEVALCNSIDSTKLTYGQLDELSDKLAKKLLDIGVSKGTLVAIIVYNTIEAVIGILGILKTGAAYVPIEPQYPVERINYILEDSKISIILHNIKLPRKLAFSGIKIDLNNYDYSEKRIDKSSTYCYYDAPAYLIYTSGSTGNPKGVIISHYSLSNYICWARDYYIEQDRIIMPLYSSIAFDLTVTSIFLPLISGGKIVIYNQNEHSNIICDILRDDLCNIIKLTPSHLEIVATYDRCDNSIMKSIIVGGAQLYSDLALTICKKFNQKVNIYNEYGPTEATVGCMIYKYDYKIDYNNIVPIGKPIKNTHIYILDCDLNPVPISMEGEIYISGTGLCRGYLNNPEQTSKCFIRHPVFGVVYRTGDIARFITSDNIEYLGRRDQQVKINGYRIEIGEIINCIKGHSAVTQALVRTIKTQEGKDILVAYYISSDKKIEEKELRKYVSQKLPHYMVPSIFFKLEKFPLTINGKIDEKNLATCIQNECNVDEVKPYNQDELIYLNAISEVLGRIIKSMNNNFFMQGGDSIKAILLSSKLKSYGYNLNVKDILFNPKFSDMFKYMVPLYQKERLNELCTGEIVQTPITEWFFSKNMYKKNSFCQNICLQLNENVVLDIYEFQEIFSYILKYHDALRISINDNNQLYYNNVCMDNASYIKRYTIKDIEEIDYKIKEITNSMATDINLYEAPLLRVCILVLPDKSLKLVIVIHHLVIDGISWRILLEDLNTLIGQKNNGQKLQLPQKTSSYMEWARYLQDEKEYALSKQDININPVLFCHKIFDKKINRKKINVYAQFDKLEQKITRDLIGISNSAYDTNPYVLMVTALIIAIKEVMNMSGIIFEVEEHGRSEDIPLDLSRTVGWFTNICPVYIEINCNDIGSCIENISNKIRNLPYSGRYYAYSNINDKWSNEKQWVKLNYLGTFNSQYDYFNVRKPENLLIDNMKNGNFCPLEVEIIVIDYEMFIYFNSMNELIDSAVAKQLFNQFIFMMRKINSYCKKKSAEKFFDTAINRIGLSKDEADRIFSERRE